MKQEIIELEEREDLVFIRLIDEVTGKCEESGICPKQDVMLNNILSLDCFVDLVTNVDVFALALSDGDILSLQSMKKDFYTLLMDNKVRDYPLPEGKSLYFTDEYRGILWDSCGRFVEYPMTLRINDRDFDMDAAEEILQNNSHVMRYKETSIDEHRYICVFCVFESNVLEKALVLARDEEDVFPLFIEALGLDKCWIIKEEFEK